MNEAAPVPAAPRRAQASTTASITAALDALAGLEGLDDRPVAEHAAVLEAVHESLRAILLESDR